MRFFRNDREFKELYAIGKRYSSEYFTFLMAKDIESAVGIVLSKKVGKANKRNKLKRHLKHYFRDFGRLDNHKVMVIGKKDSGFLDWEDVCSSMNTFQEKTLGCR